MHIRDRIKELRRVSRRRLAAESAQLAGTRPSSATPCAACWPRWLRRCAAGPRAGRRHADAGRRPSAGGDDAGRDRAGAGARCRRGGGATRFCSRSIRWRPWRRIEEHARDLLAEVQTENAAVRRLLDSLAREAPGSWKHEQDSGRIAPEVKIPESYQVVVECGDEDDQQAVFKRMREEGYRCRVLTL